MKLTPFHIGLTVEITDDPFKGRKGILKEFRGSTQAIVWMNRANWPILLSCLKIIPDQIQWLTTGRASKYGEPLSWKLHAVKATSNNKFYEVSYRVSACGRRAAWGADLFIEKKCSSCLKKTGTVCEFCGGKGSTGSTRDGSFENCYPCNLTGEKKDAD